MERFEGAPSFDPFYMAAFSDLSDERQITIGAVGAIPLSRIKEYGEFYEFFGDDLHELIWIVRTVDKHFRNVILAEKAKRAKET